jgi:hypothetical protein
MTTTILNAIKTHLQADRPAANGRPAYDASDFATLLPGGLWTRDIRPYKPGEEDAPGNTASAFDNRGRILSCLSITTAPTNQANDFGPKAAYWEQPELYFRCLPHASRKAETESAIAMLHVACRDAVLVGAKGEGLNLRIVGQIGPYDDAVITNAVLYMVRIQVDSIWKL